ncbi:MAG TPA: YcaO-like family protein [Allosphingosinicella sp.]|nr:YcaO-like family protein [Allosphingosinicella sp.]
MTASDSGMAHRTAIHHVRDHDGQRRSWEEARNDGVRLFFLLTGDDHLWLGPTQGGVLCIRCFQLWRSNRWSTAAARRATELGRVPPSPLAPALAAWSAAILGQAARATAPQGRPGAMLHASLNLLSVTEHRFIRHPECDLCPADRAGEGDPLDGMAQGAPLRAASLREIGADLLPLVVDPRCGLVRYVSHRVSSHVLPATVAALCPTGTPTDVEKGYGRTGDTRDSQTAAVLEALERYAAMSDRGGRPAIAASFAELGERAMDPSQFILHRTEQQEEPGFRLARYDPEERYDWVRAWSLRRGDSILVPAQLGYYALDRKGKVTGGRFVYETSNGCAAGASGAEAMLSGLLEVVERDAFLASWYSRVPVRRIDPSGCADELVRALVARIAAEGLALELYDIASGVAVPAIAVRAIDAEQRLGPASLYAAGAHVCPARALAAALVEVATFIQRHPPDIREAQIERGRALLADPSLVQRMDDHVEQGWPLESVEARRFTAAAETPLSWSAYEERYRPWPTTLGDAIARTVEAARAICDDVLVIDQSFEPLAGKGLHFVKVLAPGLLPITFGHQYRRVCEARLAKVPGARPDPSQARRAYIPHPFP